MRICPQRELESETDLVTGVTRPADRVQEEVVDAMNAVDIDISGQTPREITFEETKESDYVITMGCSANDVCPAGWAGENRDWDLDDPDDKSPDEVEAIRDEIAQRVSDLFDEIETADES